LKSAATSGEGIQNLMCAAHAAAALVALIAAGAGVCIVDPLAAVVVSAIAIKESVSLWQGDEDDCCAPVGFAEPTSSCSSSDSCDCCEPSGALETGNFETAVATWRQIWGRHRRRSDAGLRAGVIAG
jgi:hypothetical protein